MLDLLHVHSFYMWWSLEELYSIFVYNGNKFIDYMSATIPPPALLGPVDTGSSFMLVSIQNNQPYILNGAPYDNGIIYYWESNLTTILLGSRLGIFIAASSGNTGFPGNNFNITMVDSVNGGNVEFRSDGVTIGNGSQASHLIFQQNIYSNWWPPDVFLSTVPYTILNTSGETAGILTTPSGTGTTILADNIIILPVLWYFNCTNNGSYDIINYPLDTVTNWFCLVNPGITGCSQTDIIQSGWTNLPDCTVGNNYLYCPAGELCGNGGCKGPCSVIYDDCNYKSGTYLCQFNADKYFTETNWWTSPIFIGIIIAIVLVIFVLIIVTIAVMRHGKKIKKPPQSGYDSYYIPG